MIDRFSRIAMLAALAAAPALAQTVKVTPLGGFDGEFCAQDRALIFEDPSGTRVLYDAGRTVMGGSDPRLGKIDIILITHTHGDHLGNAHMRAIGAGTCAAPDMSVAATPNGNATNIALAKKSKIVTGSDMPSFFAAKLRHETDPSDVAAARAAGERLVLVDVRNAAAWDQGHIPGAVHLPAGQIPDRLGQLPPPEDDPDLVVYCWGPGCNGSTKAALALTLAGYRHVREMIGGFEYWVREGLAVQTDEGVRPGRPDPLTTAVAAVRCDC